MNENQLNSYELSRKWFNYSFDNPEKVKPIHSAIYFFAIEHCNRLGWKQKFGFPSQMVMEAIGVKNWRTYSKALNDLVNFGFIEMIEISKNQYSSNIVAIVKNTKAPTKALDKALQKHDTKQGQSTVSINKQETNNNITKNKVYSKEVNDCLNNCLNYFPIHLQPKNISSWLDTIEKLNRIDNIPFEIIEEIVKKTREDNFWSKNFLSLNKLRQKNKDGIYYSIVFNEQIKSKNGNNKTRRQIFEEKLKEQLNSNE